MMKFSKQEQIKFFIGVDTSSTHTAIVILNNKGGLVSHYLIEPSCKDLRDRGLIIYKECINIINTFNPEITNVIIEAPAFMAKGKVADLAMITGAIYYTLSKDFNVVLAPPSTVKKFFTGNGRAKKEDMLAKCPEYLINTFKKTHKKIDDLVDGYALAMYGLLSI